MPPSKHHYYPDTTDLSNNNKRKPVVGPKIRALRNDYADVTYRLRELIRRFEILAKDCEHKDKCLFCYVEFCPIVSGKKEG